MAQLLAGGTGIELDIERQRAQRRGMGAGQTELQAQQMADHRFGAGQGIHSAALAVGGQGSAVRVVGEASHHGDGGGPGRLQLPAGPQQRLRPPELSPAHAAGAEAELHVQGLIGDHHRADLEAKRGAATIGHLHVAPAQLLLDAGVKQQADPLAPHRAQSQLARRKAIKAGTLHVVNARVAPVERGPVHHIGMGDEATAGSRQQPCGRQGVTGVTTDGTTDPGGHHQKRRQRRSRSTSNASGIHASTTASICRRVTAVESGAESGGVSGGVCGGVSGGLSGVAAVIAQRSGRPWAANASRIWGRSGPGRRSSCSRSGTSLISDTDRTGLRRGHPPGRQAP